ncbi:MAG: glycosyltransferase family 9 protein [Opitutales bacterium]
MLKLLLSFLGWVLAHAPESGLRGLAAALGEAVFLLPGRRRIMLSNLGHAFPAREPAALRRIARASSRRLIETALLSLATPHLSPARLRRIVRSAPETQAAFARWQATPEPTLFATAHMAYWEIQTCLPLLVPEPFPEFGVIFRPVDNMTLDAWVKQTRGRFGMRLLSRKEGFQEALKILRRKGIIGLLFDQNAGLQGALTLLFGRVCSSTELPGLLAGKFGARVYAIHPRRLGFWRIELQMEEIHSPKTTEDVTLALNRWLEAKLSSSDDWCASWLWAHERWKNQDIPSQRLRLDAKRDLLAADLAARGLGELPRRTRLWIRLPNWLGDVVMARPLLKAVRASRPDAEITLVAKAAFLPLLESWGVADHLLALPARGPGYFAAFRRWRARFPDCYLLFTNSLRGDLEAWLTGCRQRFGLVRPGKWRPLLSHAYRVPAAFDERQHHQLELWTTFLQHFGLAQAPDPAPFPRPGGPAGLVVGLIAGSENNPEKRWPVTYWCELIRLLPAHARLVLFGTARDRPITAAIAASCGRPVEDLAGRTNLPDYCTRLAACTVLVTNDTGGMHLANALGVPLVALFGPTNPVRTRPVHAAPVEILQPPGCPPTGGARLADLRPPQVLAALRRNFPDSFPVE